MWLQLIPARWSYRIHAAVHSCPSRTDWACVEHPQIQHRCRWGMQWGKPRSHGRWYTAYLQPSIHLGVDSSLCLCVHKHILAHSKRSKMFIDYLSIHGNKRTCLYLWRTSTFYMEYLLCVYTLSHTLFVQILQLSRSYVYVHIAWQQKRAFKMGNWPMSSPLALKVLKCKLPALFSTGDKAP